MNDQTVLKRIRKLLAMGSDTSSPEEAAIAASRARALMDKYQVSELDLTSVESSNFSASTHDTGKKRGDKPDSVLAVTVAKLNDCQVRYATDTITISLVFRGMFADAVCATELFKYLREEGVKQSKRFCKGRANIFAYRLGFANGVVSVVNDILIERYKLTTSDNKALVVCKQELVAEHYGNVKYKKERNKFSGSEDSFNAGVVAGQKASLNRQVSGASTPLLN